jgi:hypothetical protein
VGLLENLSTKDVEEAFKKSQEEIAIKLKLPDMETTTDPMSLKVPKDFDSRQLITQYLQDLGYIEEGGTLSISDIAQANGIKQWKRDNDSTPAGVFKYDQQHSLFKFHQLSSNNADFLYLVAQMGFEAEVKIGRIPALGEVSLLSRIIHFRLRVFGVYTQAVDTPFSEVSLDAIKALATVLKLSQNPDIQVINILGDVKTLSQIFIKHQGTWVFVFNQRPASTELLKETHIHNIDTINKDILNLKNKKRKWTYEQIFVSTGEHYKDRNGSRVWAGRNGLRYYRKAQVWGRVKQLVNKRLSPSEAETTLVNKFGFELLQLRLWLLGFYNGELDGDFGPLTMLAVKEFLLDSEIKNINQLIKPVEGDYAVINMRYLFNRLFTEADIHADSINEDDAQALSLQIFSEAKQDKQWVQLEQAHVKIEKQESGNQSAQKKRRRAFSFKGILSAAGRFFRNVVGGVINVVKKVWKALKKMSAYAVKLFKRGIETIKQGVQIVSLAVKRAYYWLLEKPIFSTKANSLVVTRFSHDGDAFHFISNPNKDLIKRHHLVIRRMNLAFSIMASLGFKALGIIKNFSSLNWLRLAWKLFSILSDDFWHELKRAYTHYKTIQIDDVRFS